MKMIKKMMMCQTCDVGDGDGDGDGDVSGVMLVVSFHKGQMIESGEAGVPSLKDHKG